MWAFFYAILKIKQNDSLSHFITIQNTDFKPLYAEVWYYIYFSLLTRICTQKEHLQYYIIKSPWPLLFTVVFLQLLNENWTLEKVNRRCRVSEPVEFGGLPSPQVVGQLAIPAAAAVSVITYRFPYTVVIDFLTPGNVLTVLLLIRVRLTSRTSLD